MSKTIIILLLSLTSIRVAAQTEWKLKKEEDGIKVFAGSMPNSDFKAVKVECIVKASLCQLVAFLLDVDKQHDWIYNNKSARVLKKISDNELISYSEYSIPWPCCNRDYVSHVTFTQQSPLLMTIDARAEPEFIPSQEGKVRVKNSVSHWEITKLGNNQLQIVYTVNCDPAGAIPAWLTNMFVVKGPYQTFQKLRVSVTDPRYEKACFNFIKE